MDNDHRGRRAGDNNNQRRGRGCQRGAALIEFALVFPILALLLFGTVDFGMVLLNTNSARQGTREGARQAVVAHFGNSEGCVVTPNTISGTPRKLICLTKNRIGLDAADTRIKIAFPGANQVGNSLLLCAQYPTRSTTGIMAPVLNGRVVRTKVEMRIEQVDTNLTATAETALSGQDWLWCA